MIVLAMETATAVCGAALIEDDRVLKEEFIEVPQKHSEHIIGLIERTLEGAGTNLHAIDALAVSIGPGSFTGLRVGLSVAKGLACAVEKPLTAVSTLEALARNVARQQALRGPALVLSTIDARRDELFAAAYRVENSHLTQTISPRAVFLEELYHLLDGEQKIILVGNGTEKFQEFIMKIDTSGRFVIPSRELRVCSAAAVGLVGVEQLLRGEKADISSLEPLYIKEFFTTMKPPHHIKH